MRTTRWVTLLLMVGTLASCASTPGPPPQWLDAQTNCQQQGQASTNSPGSSSDAYTAQCMIAHGFRP
jgi:hypothetical protein